MATINFLYRSTKNESNLNIRLLFTHNSEPFVIGAKTKYRVSKHYWTKQHKKNVKDIEIINKKVEVNNELNKIENHILKAFDSTNIEDVSKEWLQQRIERYYNPPLAATTIPNKLSEYAQYYIDCKQHEVSKATLTKYKTIKKKIEAMETERGKPYLISEINESFKNDFHKFYKSNSYSINTMHKELAFIKTFCKHARNNGIETSLQLDGLKLPQQKVEKIYLTFDEVAQIESTELESVALNNARDWLIISCYTGQRVSDFLRFTKDMVRIEDGIKLIEFTQKKTNKKMSLALHPKVIELLEKNKGNFPYKVSDQRYNEYIKEVARLSELTAQTFGSKQKETAPESKIFRKESGHYPKYELITSHIGRRSYATNFYGKIPTALLMSATGHTTEAMFLQYIGKTQTQQAKELAKYY